MLVEGRPRADSALAGFCALFELAPLAGFELIGALAAGFRAVLELVLAAVSAMLLLGSSVTDAAGVSAISALGSAGKRCRKSAWPAPVAGCASRST